VIVVAFTFVGSFIILKVTDLISALSISPEEREVGQDLSQHGENVFQFDLTASTKDSI
jgi:Amt family ammonium transporter